MATMPDLDIDLKKMKLSEINGASYNPRKSVHDIPEFYEKLYGSLLRLGYVSPIVVNVRDGKNVIVGGNQRYAVICDMAEDSGKRKEDVEISVITVDLSEAEEMTANIALNKIHGDWLQEKLREDLDIINQLDDTLLNVTGFDDEDIDTLIEEVIEEDNVPTEGFKIIVKLDPSYENFYEFYISTNGEEAFKKEVIKIITGA